MGSRGVQGASVKSTAYKGPGGGARRFTSARRTKGGPGACPRFRPRRTRVGLGGLPPGLDRGVQGGVPGAYPPPLDLGHSAWN